MSRIVLAAAVLAMLSLSAPRPAAADTTETLAYTFALTLGGTIAGAYAFPYVVPAAAPTVQAAYAATAAAFDGAFSTTGAFLLLEPRMIGSITGMTSGLVGGLYVFGEEEQEVVEAVTETSNTAVTVRR